MIPGGAARPVAAAFIAFAVALSISAAGEPPAAPPAIVNFGVVEDGVYRGSGLGPKEVAELQRLGVRTVLKLNHRGSDEERRACEAVGIRLVEIPLATFDIADDDAKHRQALCNAIRTLRDPLLRPIYVHCTHGVDRTGAVIGIYRRLVDGWDLEKIHREMEKFGSGPLRRLLTRGVYRAVESFEDRACSGGDQARPRVAPPPKTTRPKGSP